MLNGTWKKLSAGPPRIGRIKCGTESNGGFRNIAISNCVFENSWGFALESVDGALCEDISIVGITMRGALSAPMFLRLGRRMRGPKDARIGTLKRVLISNITSYDAVQLPSILSGIRDYPIEDVKISDVYLHQIGGGDSSMLRIEVPEMENGYPDPFVFGPIPAAGFFLRHIRNLEMSNIEIATANQDARPAFTLVDVAGADFFRIRAPRPSLGPAFSLKGVSDFRVFGSQFISDQVFSKIEDSLLGN
jgi:polygalacturonase